MMDIIWQCYIPTPYPHDTFPPGGNMAGGNLLVSPMVSLTPDLVIRTVSHSFGCFFVVAKMVIISDNYSLLSRSVVSRGAQCQTINQKMTVRLGSQHSDPSQGEDFIWFWIVTNHDTREELALIENRILEKEMAAKRRAERLAKNIAVNLTHYYWLYHINDLYHAGVW